MDSFVFRRPSFRLVLVLALSALLLPMTGCGGKKKSGAKKDYGKPTWLKVDPAKFAKLSEYETNLEGGAITVFDPEGWERMPAGKAPKGFKSVIRFNSGPATILMTKSREARDMPDLDRDNIEEFATAAQQSFRSPVKMVELGNIVGVYFSKAAKASESLSRKLERRVIATSLNGQLFTYELIADQGKINQELLNALFAVVSRTRIEGMEEADEPATQVAAAPPTEAPLPETKEEPKTEIAAAPAKPEPKEEPKVEVAAAPLPEAKPEAKPEPKKAEPKAEPKKAAAKKPAKKGNTKDILNELDALLN